MPNKLSQWTALTAPSLRFDVPGGSALILVAVTVFLFPYRIGKLHNLVDWLSNTPGQEDVITVVSSADNGNGAITVTVRDNRVFTEETARYTRLRVPVP